MKVLLDNKDFEEAEKLLIEYSSDKKDVNEMKTLLIITNGFKTHRLLRKSRIKLLTAFNSKMEALKSKFKVYYNGVEVKEGKKGDPI